MRITGPVKGGVVVFRVASNAACRDRYSSAKGKDGDRTASVNAASCPFAQSVAGKTKRFSLLSQGSSGYCVAASAISHAKQTVSATASKSFSADWIRRGMNAVQNASLKSASNTRDGYCSRRKRPASVTCPWRDRRRSVSAPRVSRVCSQLDES